MTPEARRARIRQRYRQATGATVDGVGVRRRLRALVSFGWSTGDLAAAMGQTTETVTEWTAPPSGSHGDSRIEVTPAQYRRAVAVFNRLQMIPGPCEQARRFGFVHHWPLPFEWDEDTLDNPAARPTRSRRTHAAVTRERSRVRRDRDRLIGELAGHGWSDDGIARRLGLHPDSVGGIRRRLFTDTPVTTHITQPVASRSVAGHGGVAPLPGRVPVAGTGWSREWGWSR